MINEAVQSDPKATHLIQSIITQFNYRTAVEGKKTGTKIVDLRLEIEVGYDFIMWLHFSSGAEKHSVSFPIPFVQNNVQLIQQNEVLRATSNFWLEDEGREVDYHSAMYAIVLSDCTGLVQPALAKKSSYLQQMVYGFINGNASIIANRFQKAINDVVHRMPLHETLMNSWIMNQRLMFVDPMFEEILSPADKLQYQRVKAQKYFDRGWTPIGLSDGVMADKNYILKTDLRAFSPFGIRYHNPQRNLYSTLGMKGDELPRIRSASMQALMDAGVKRTGWNLVTAFVDIPDVFEDQIMIGKHLVDKMFVNYERRLQVFGDMLVEEGESIKCGTAIGTSPDGGVKTFRVRCDKAHVKHIAEAKVSVGGNATKVFNVVIEYSRRLRDGFKITNLHGNKGVVRVADLGYAINPSNGQRIVIDVIVGAKTVGKRKNYGQILEALFSCTLNSIDQYVVLPDDWYQPLNSIEDGLERRGYRRDGTWDCDTYAGKVKAVVGRVFWGCIKTPEDQIWEEEDALSRNCCEVRTKGLKFSHVEVRALKTRLGDDNPVLDELLSYAQGTENLHELLKMAEAKRGRRDTSKPLLSIENVKPLDQANGTITPEQYIHGTVVDEFFMPDGFNLKLPLPYQTIFCEDGEIAYEGHPMDAGGLEAYTAETIYVPSGIMRKCWKHENGMYGLSELGVIINNLLVMSHKLLAGWEDPNNHRLYYNALSNFFGKLSKMLCSKRGSISTLGMAIRYPFSIKAVATQSTTLPKNTVEIHRNMAKVLKVRNGDVVLAERFPCLGFMSVRLQKVRITDDPHCEYTIRVSGNSLVSQNLDHDGDVLFLAAFHTKAAKHVLRKEFENPNQTCYGEICKLNERKGAPHIKCYALEDFKISPFENLSNARHADLVEQNTGVKAQTGPVIALTYNLMRIVENSDIAQSQKMKVAVEMFLEKAAQSVFEQKHGGRSLYDIVIDGVCTANTEMLVEVGFKRSTTEKLCSLIRHKATSIGVFNLDKYHKNWKKYGGSNIISKIVRIQNRIYFASRSKLEAITLLKSLNSPAVDIPSEIFSWIMSGKAQTIKTELDKVLTEKMLSKASCSSRAACAALIDVVDTLFAKKKEASISECFAKRLLAVRKNASERCFKCHS